MNARGLLITCLAFIMCSIILVPALAHIGLHDDVASALSSLSLLGGIATAFMTVGKEKTNF